MINNVNRITNYIRCISTISTGHVDTKKGKIVSRKTDDEFLKN
jgi:hypothetical protein